MVARPAVKISNPYSRKNVKVEISSDGENFTDITHAVKRYQINHGAGDLAPSLVVEFVDITVIDWDLGHMPE